MGVWMLSGAVTCLWQAFRGAVAVTTSREPRQRHTSSHTIVSHKRTRTTNTGVAEGMSHAAQAAASVDGEADDSVPLLQNSFWLTRIVLLRGMGLIYLAAFLTSAVQSRAMFGTLGISPAIGMPSGRPTPAFDALRQWAGVPTADVALEGVSWAGVLGSLVLAFGPDICVLWSGLPALLWVM